MLSLITLLTYLVDPSDFTFFQVIVFWLNSNSRSTHLLNHAMSMRSSSTISQSPHHAETFYVVCRENTGTLKRHSSWGSCDDSSLRRAFGPDDSTRQKLLRLDTPCQKYSEGDGRSGWKSMQEHQFDGYVSHVLSNATEILRRRHSYREFFEDAHHQLRSVEDQLKGLLATQGMLEESKRHEVCRHLAEVYFTLGRYEDAEGIYRSLCPTLSTISTYVQYLHCTKFHEGQFHVMSTLLAYYAFLAATGRNLDLAEALGRTLPWTTVFHHISGPEKAGIFLDLMRILNYQKQFSEALRHIDAMSNVQFVNKAGCYLQSAIALTGQGQETNARRHFLMSLVQCYIEHGLWHAYTLLRMLRFGSALKSWGDHEGALELLIECCMGLHYKFGPSHPLSIEALQELESSEGSAAGLAKVVRFIEPGFSEKKKRSLAFEHSMFITPIDFVSWKDPVELEAVITILERYLAGKYRFEGAFRARRMLLRIKLMQGNLDAFQTISSEIHSEVQGHLLHLTIHTLDWCFLGAQSLQHTRTESSKTALAHFRTESSEEFKAVHRRLAAAGLTHFSSELIFNFPPLLSEAGSKRIGQGQSGAVDTVFMGEQVFARKSIRRPLGNNFIRETIQNEVSVLSKLEHPHIVRILLTYEDKKHFYLVMKPVAECNLQELFAQNPRPSALQAELAYEWLMCLTNTLAYIHSNGIRHKDIKPHNILVKGKKVIFADFGSSYTWADEGNSTTDGLAYGHTRMYCAPEVFQNESRNRSTDVFSLGCVLTELITWTSTSTVAEYHVHRKQFKAENREGDGNYHASLDQVTSWFRQTLGKTEPRQLYDRVLVHMLRRAPKRRDTALATSKKLVAFFQGTNRALNCSKCRSELWVDTEADSH